MLARHASSRAGPWLRPTWLSGRAEQRTGTQGCAGERPAADTGWACFHSVSSEEGSAWVVPRMPSYVTHHLLLEFFFPLGVVYLSGSIFLSKHL